MPALKSLASYVARDLFNCPELVRVLICISTERVEWRDKGGKEGRKRRKGKKVKKEKSMKVSLVWLLYTFGGCIL